MPPLDDKTGAEKADALHDVRGNSRVAQLVADLPEDGRAAANEGVRAKPGLVAARLPLQPNSRAEAQRKQRPQEDVELVRGAHSCR